MATSGFDPQQSLDSVDDEQLPVPPHKQHGAKHFLGLYAAEHVAATEFVIGATFVGLGAGIWDILIGLVIGNTLAILSFTLITAPIAVGTRLSLFAYLERIAGNVMAKLYNGANVVIFAAISVAMITVSASAFRVLTDIPPQVGLYPTSASFVILALLVGASDPVEGVRRVMLMLALAGVGGIVVAAGVDTRPPSKVVSRS